MPRPQTDFGRLAPVEIRECWEDEARDFTPWLASAAGLALLQEAVGIELAVEGTEVPVGGKRADIVARDLATNQRVVIENQLDRTDHDHLGKAVTYSAVLGAEVIVWVARSFSDEHKKTVEWLNELTKGALQFYGVELQVWRIGGSSPAPRFEIVCAPNEVVRQATEAAAASDESSETQQLQLEFWTEVRKWLERTGEFRSLRTPRPRYWYDLALGRAGVHLSLYANTVGKSVGVRVVFASGLGEVALPQLEPMRPAIEQQIGARLDWNPYPQKAVKTIRLSHDGDIADRSQWPALADWLAKTTVAMKRAFAPLVADLDLSRGGGGASDDDGEV